MPRRVLDRIRAAIRNAAYDMTVHAVEEMAEDDLDLIDVEMAILHGRLIKTEKDDPRGPRHTVHGTGADGRTAVGSVGRFTETGRLLIVTVYRVTEHGT
ncbi:MAG: DUF4258 domain-containing protein [candidate division NC10 bacterium]